MTAKARRARRLTQSSEIRARDMLTQSLPDYHRFPIERGSGPTKVLGMSTEVSDAALKGFDSVN